MRAYRTLVFDEVLEGTNVARFSSSAFNSELGSTERLSIFVVTDSVSGTATLSIAVQESPDGIRFSNKNAAPEISSASLSTVDNTIAVGRDMGTNLGSGFTRLVVVLNGTNVRAHIRVWATGRGERSGNRAA